MTGSLSMNPGIHQIVKTRSARYLEKIHQLLFAWMPHLPHHSAAVLLQYLFARNVPRWLLVTSLKRSFW